MINELKKILDDAEAYRRGFRRLVEMGYENAQAVLDELQLRDEMRQAAVERVAGLEKELAEWQRQYEEYEI